LCIPSHSPQEAFKHPPGLPGKCKKPKNDKTKKKKKKTKNKIKSEFLYEIGARHFTNSTFLKSFSEN
jgi:hypothetical protein